jgi:hypothetical protein
MPPSSVYSETPTRLHGVLKNHNRDPRRCENLKILIEINIFFLLI